MKGKYDNLTDRYGAWSILVWYASRRCPNPHSVALVNHSPPLHDHTRCRHCSTCLPVIYYTHTPAGAASSTYVIRARAAPSDPCTTINVWVIVAITRWVAEWSALGCWHRRTPCPASAASAACIDVNRVCIHVRPSIVLVIWTHSFPVSWR